MQRRHCRLRLPGRSGWAADGDRFVLGLGGLASLQRDGVRSQCPGAQSGGQAGDQMLMAQVAAQQQNLDQGPGAVPFSMDLAGLGPPGVVDRGELACRAGLFQRGGAGESARFADQSLQWSSSRRQLAFAISLSCLDTSTSLP